jgi:hypothetical protein
VRAAWIAPVRVATPSFLYDVPGREVYAHLLVEDGCRQPTEPLRGGVPRAIVELGERCVVIASRLVQAAARHVDRDREVGDAAVANRERCIE